MTHSMLRDMRRKTALSFAQMWKKHWQTQYEHAKAQNENVRSRRERAGRGAGSHLQQIEEKTHLDMNYWKAHLALVQYDINRVCAALEITEP
jgi:hypothetical protein